MHLFATPFINVHAVINALQNRINQVCGLLSYENLTTRHLTSTIFNIFEVF